jgi:hypothetical protein
MIRMISMIDGPMAGLSLTAAALFPGYIEAMSGARQRSITTV